MNAPAQLAHLAPDIRQRAVPAELIAALQGRFPAQCSTALAVREQHGRDESVRRAATRRGGVCPEHTGRADAVKPPRCTRSQ
jgi:D-lactate dehydrogenase (cytochrome)